MLSFQKILIILFVSLCFAGFAKASVSFISPTLANNTITTNSFFIINGSVVSPGLTNFVFDWNQTNYSLYDPSTYTMFSFNNDSFLGENNTYFVDSSSFGNNATCSNSSDSYGPTFCPTFNSSGKYGGALSFNSTQQLITSINNVGISGNQDRTISFWAYPFSASSDQYLLGWGNNTLDHRFAIMIMGSGDWYVWSWSSDDFQTSSAAIPDTWTYVAVTFDNSIGSFGQETVYINGQNIGQYNLTATRSTANTPLTMGHTLDTGNRSYDYNGMLDQVQIWNRSLTASEIAEQYMSNLYQYSSTQWYLYVNQTKNVTNGLDLGTYSYQGYENDSSGLNQSLNQIINVDLPLEENLSSPFSHYITNTSQNYFIANVSGFNLANATLYIWNSSGSLIGTNTTTLTGSTNSTNISFTLPSQGTYYWNILSEDNFSATTFAVSNFTIKYNSSFSGSFVSSCRSITQSGLYFLENNITFSGSDCIFFNGGNILLDGNGFYLIDNTDPYHRAVDAFGQNETIQNMNILSYGDAIFLNNVNESTISGNIFYNQNNNNSLNEQDEIQLQNSSYNNITNNSFNSNYVSINSSSLGRGIYAISLNSSSQNSLTNNSIINYQLGLNLQNSSYNNISDNLIRNVEIGAYDNYSGNNDFSYNNISLNNDSVSALEFEHENGSDVLDNTFFNVSNGLVTYDSINLLVGSNNISQVIATLEPIFSSVNLSDRGDAILLYSTNHTVISNNDVVNISNSGNGNGIQLDSGSSYNNITGNSVYYLTQGSGITDDAPGTNNTIDSDNVSYALINSGISIGSSYDVVSNSMAWNNAYSDFGSDGFSTLFINDTAWNSPNDDFLLSAGGDLVVLRNVTAYDSGPPALDIYQSDVSVIDSHFYNNSMDIAETTVSNLSLSNVIFDNPLGNYVNYSNISLTEGSIPSYYSISWISPPSLPTGVVNLSTINISGGALVNISWALQSASSASIYGLNGSNWSTLTSNSDTVYLSLSNLNLSTYSSNTAILGISHGPVSISESHGGGTSLSLFSFSFSPSCSGNVVTLTGGSSPLSGAYVYVEDSSTSDTIYSGYSDSSGQVNFTGCGKTVNIQVNDPGYQNQVYTESLAACACGTIQSSSSNDSSTITQSPPPLTNPSPTTNASDQPNPTPLPTPNAITVPTSTQVGNVVMIQATLSDGSPCINCQVEVVDPTGNILTLTTDATGSLSFTPSMSGTYTFNLMNNGSVITSTTMNVGAASPSQSSAAQPVVNQPPIFLVLGIIAVVFIIAVGIYFFMVNKKKK